LKGFWLQARTEQLGTAHAQSVARNFNLVVRYILNTEAGNTVVAGHAGGWVGRNQYILTFFRINVQEV
jgi:hypothetical protein